MYDEMGDLGPEERRRERELDDLIADLETASVDTLEDPRLDLEKAEEESEDLDSFDLATDLSDKTTDPVRMYLREMGTVPPLTREGEIELAKRVERGQRGMMKSLSRSPLVINQILEIGQQVSREEIA